MERLARHHLRQSFACGVAELDRYLAQQARQDDERRVCRVWCLVEDGGSEVVGYYTLSAHTVQLADVPAELARRLPRYPLVPAMLIGRLALAAVMQGSGWGAALLADALARCLALSADIGAVMVVVQAKDESAASFYARHGFRAFADDPLALFLPLATVAGAAAS